MTTTASNTIAPFSEPMYIMAKPAGAACNLHCEYCYYLKKKRYYPDNSNGMMSDELLEKFIRQYIESQTLNVVLFTWHGGEPLLRPLSFYKKAIELQKKYAGGRVVNNCLQTNGTLLTDEWCDFLKKNNFLVGISIDGAENQHNRFRKMQQGGATFQQVMRAITLLNRYGVDWNAMATVNSFNAGAPLEFYHFFKQIDCRFLQFTPVVERDENGNLTTTSISPVQWGNFICQIFNEWVQNDVGKIFVQLFDATLANWTGMQPGVCSLAKTCGHAAIMEHNGDVYSCDHFVFSQYLVGNIYQQTLLEIMYSPQQRAFGMAKQQNLSEKCKKCPYLFACNGECPKNRFSTVGQPDEHLNYLCEGYYRFFEHSAPAMNFMCNEWLNKRPPANIMKQYEAFDSYKNKV